MGVCVHFCTVNGYIWCKRREKQTNTDEPGYNNILCYTLRFLSQPENYKYVMTPPRSGAYITHSLKSRTVGPVEHRQAAAHRVHVVLRAWGCLSPQVWGSPEPGNLSPSTGNTIHQSAHVDQSPLPPITPRLPGTTHSTITQNPHLTKPKQKVINDRQKPENPCHQTVHNNTWTIGVIR